MASFSYWFFFNFAKFIKDITQKSLLYLPRGPPHDDMARVADREMIWFLWNAFGMVRGFENDLDLFRDDHGAIPPSWPCCASTSLAEVHSLPAKVTMPIFKRHPLLITDAWHAWLQQHEFLKRLVFHPTFTFHKAMRQTVHNRADYFGLHSKN